MRFFAVCGFLLIAPLLAAQREPARGEIPLERCDRLSVAKARIGGKDYRFLLDTGATSFLNLRTFSTGRDRIVEIASWKNVDSTLGRDVILEEIVFGDFAFKRLRLPAIDLDPIGKACGKQIDGILGVDLLERMGATIDLKQRVASVPAVTFPGIEESVRSAIRECTGYFNAGNKRSFGECLSADMDWFTPWGKITGRNAIVAYFDRRFFSQKAHSDFICTGLRFLGDAVVLEYEYTMQLPSQQYHARGTAVVQKQQGAWRLVSMHNSTVDPVSEPQPPGQAKD